MMTIGIQTANELGYKQYKGEQICATMLIAILVDLTSVSSQTSMPYVHSPYTLSSHDSLTMIQ